MSSTIKINCCKKMSAEEVLEEIRYPLENLESFLMAMSKMKVDDYLTDDEFTSIINMLHQQVAEITHAVKLG